MSALVLLDLSSAFVTVDPNIFISHLGDIERHADNPPKFNILLLKNSLQLLLEISPHLLPLLTVAYLRVLYWIPFCFVVPLARIICNRNTSVHCYADDIQLQVSIVSTAWLTSSNEIKKHLTLTVASKIYELSLIQILRLLIMLHFI